MGRIQGLAESPLLTENQLLKTGAGYVFSITIGYTGVTKGHYCSLRDGLDNSAASPHAVVFVFGDTSGTITREWSQGKYFGTGIYFDEGATNGQVWVEITYR